MCDAGSPIMWIWLRWYCSVFFRVVFTASACVQSSFTINSLQGSTTLVTVDCVPITQWHDVIFNNFKQGAGYDLLVLDRCVSPSCLSSKDV